MRFHPFVVALFALLALILVMTPALAEDVRSISLQISGDGSLLVVHDPLRRALAVYRVEGNKVTLIAQRDIAKDFETEPAKTSARPAAPPTKDVPGRDAPDFTRPEKSVRVSAAYSTSKESEVWEVEYLVNGTLSDVYDTIRSSTDTWNVTDERYMRPPFSRAEIRLSKDRVEMSIVVDGAGRPEGWIGVKVEDRRKKP